MKPRVDVGMVTWNTRDLTLEVLGRLLHSDQGCDLRLLVHDNASEDGTSEAIRSQFPEAEVSASQENLGFARAVNLLLERSSAPYFLLLNSDAWPEVGAVGRLVEAIGRAPRSAAVAPRLESPSGQLEHSVHPFPSLWISLLTAAGVQPPARLARSWLLEGSFAHDRPRRVDWAVGAALLISRQAVEEIGPFDESFFMYVEDLEWCHRARKKGFDVLFEPASLFRHVGNASGARRFGEKRVALEVSNLHAFYRRTHSAPVALTYRLLESTGCLRAERAAALRGAGEEARYWRRRAMAHLGLLRPGSMLGASCLATSPGFERRSSDRSRTDPLVSVAVSTCGRSAMAARLLACLEKQTLALQQFEVVIVDNFSEDDTAEVLAKVAESSPLRLLVMRARAREGPSAGRNLAWRATTAPVVAFTDDDCMPSPSWLEEGLAAMGQHRRIVVGRTEPSPGSEEVAKLPFSRSVLVEEPRFFETCNVFYRREDLAAAQGFFEGFVRPGGEDTDLALRVMSLGAEPVFAPRALVHHEVWASSLKSAIAHCLRWVDIPLFVHRNGRVGRRFLVGRIFWKRSHPFVLVAVAGFAGVLSSRRMRWLVALAPWAGFRLLAEPSCPGPFRRIVALPGAFLVDATEVAVMVVGSLKHRWLVL